MVVIAVLSACGGGECKDGTVRYHDTCYPFDPLDKTPPVVTVDPPVRTRNVGNVRLTTDEPATIYVTTDDTAPTTDSQHEADQIVLPDQPNDVIMRFFAIDLAGNQSAEQEVIWNIDQDGPAPPIGFHLDLSGSSRTLAWTAPTDAHPGGVLVARVEGRLTIEPESGKSYAIGDTLAPGVTVVKSDAADVMAGTFTESLAADPGIVRYVAWAFDDLLNYGPPAGEFALVPLPPQFGSFTINSAAGTVATNPKPSNLTISGSATFNAGTLTAKISLRNDTTRVIYAPKVIATNTISGGTWANPDGTISSKPFRAYGAAIMPGNSFTADWVFTGVTAGTNIKIDLDVNDNPLLLAAENDPTSAGTIHDQQTTLQLASLNAGPSGPRGGYGTLSGGFTVDGRVVFGARTGGAISSYDLATGTKLATNEFAPQKSHIAQVVLDHSGTVGYAIVGQKHPREAYRSGFSTASRLVRFDASTLRTHGGVDLDVSRNRDLQLSADETKAYIATGIASQGVIEVDLTTLKITRRLMAATRSDGIALAPNHTLIVVGGDIEFIDLDNGMITKTLPLPQPSGKILRTLLADPNTLWLGMSTGTTVVSLLDNGPAPVAIARRGRVLALFDDKVYAGDTLVQRFSIDGTLDPTTQYNFSQNRGHWLGRTPF